MSKAHEFLRRLVPESKAQGLQARGQSDGFDVLEYGVCLVTALEVVVRNARAQVMDVMEPYVSGQPLQDPRQLVVRAALQRRGGVVPALFTLPVGVFELMLDVEEPDSGGARHHPC